MPKRTFKDLISHIPEAVKIESKHEQSPRNDIKIKLFHPLITYSKTVIMLKCILIIFIDTHKYTLNIHLNVNRQKQFNPPAKHNALYEHVLN